MKNKKIIFLDIDGVLNAPGDTDLLDDIISKKRIKLYKKIIRKTKAKTVIISSRKYYEDERKIISKIFTIYKIKYEYISTEFNGLTRLKEIEKYLKDNNVSKFCIVDDNDYEYTLEPFYNRRFVKIDVRGLIEKYLNDCIHCLDI